ncbi:MAG: LptE family protein [Bacteroidetes bacterium]|nr:LptE family protein [Bacteroidota bacterium]
MKGIKGNLGICFLAILFTLSGCKGCYRLSGINIPADVKSISVKFFPNKAAIINPTLSQRFTEQLKDKFLRETSLTLVANNGDFKISGEIIDYKTEPIAFNTSTGTAKNRFSMTVRTVFECSTHKDLNFTENIVKFQEFDATQNFQTVEANLSDEVNKQIVQEIFNKIALKW